MEHIQFTWQTSDGLQTFTQGWQPEGQTSAVVCFVHGLGEHTGRYSHVGAALAQAGYALLGFDLRGHGHSQGRRGHAPSWEALLDDILCFLEQVAERVAGRPRFLYGHSLGANLVLSFALRRPPQLAGVIATAPVLRPAFAPPAWKISLGQLMYRLWPTFTMSNELDPNGLSRDRDVVSAYVNDSLVHDRLSARLGMDMLSAGQWLLDHAADLTLPLLLMHGSADPVCSPQATRDFADRAGGDPTYKAWDGLYHEIHNEPERQRVLDTLIAWLKARAPA